MSADLNSICSIICTVKIWKSSKKERRSDNCALLKKLKNIQTQISSLSFILQKNKKVEFGFCHSGHSLQFSAKSAERNGCRPLWAKMGQLALSKGPAKIGICYHVQRANILSKGFINLILACPEYSNMYIMYMCV
jgi:hypothetical protein